MALHVGQLEAQTGLQVMHRRGSRGARKGVTRLPHWMTQAVERLLPEEGLTAAWIANRINTGPSGVAEQVTPKAAARRQMTR